MPEQMRLDKFLADMGRGTRSQLREAVRRGRVLVNGAVCKKADTKIFVPGDIVLMDGEAVTYVGEEYYMLNKPQGVVSATEDGRHRTALDLIGEKARRDLFPAGRLDIDTEGLLLITNDGALAHRLLSPKRHVDKVYFARCAGDLPEETVGKFQEGIVLPDGLRCLPAKLEILSRSKGGERPDAREDRGFTEIRLTIHEGKFHQVKRMMEAAGCPVLYLKRLSMGPLLLDEALSPGEYRRLTKEEVELLKQL